MTIGLGIDLVEISRMEKAMENGHFLRRVFTEAERAYAEHGGNAAQHYAGMFAAKEAAAKALRTGFSGFGFLDIEVLRDGESAPSLRFHRGAEKRAEALGVKRSFVSISHERTLAAAQVLLEG